MLPIGLPVSSVKNMIVYLSFSSKYMGTVEALRWETGQMHELPQDDADMLGWEEDGRLCCRNLSSTHTCRKR